MDKLTSMRIFMEVVERGGFARAAECLKLTPAVVTRHVASLEKQLGTPLLIRTTRSMRLTQRGEIYLERVRTLLNDLDETESLVGSAANAFAGSLRFSVPVNFGLHILPPILRQFHYRYPMVQFEIDLTDDPVDFTHTGQDFCVTFAENISQLDNVTRKLLTAKTILCATPEYLKRSPGLASPNDLANHCCIIMKRGRVLDNVWHFRRSDGQLSAFRVLTTVSCNSSAMVHECLLNDLGVGRIGAYLAEPAIRNGLLVNVLPEYDSPEAELVVAYPGRTYLTSKARAFTDFLSESVLSSSSS